MEKECDFYYKCKSKDGFHYCGVKLLSKEQGDIDLFLDQINNMNAKFIQKKEFERNIKYPLEIDVTDNNDDNTILGKAIYGHITRFQERFLKFLLGTTYLLFALQIIFIYWAIDYFLHGKIWYGLFELACSGYGIYMGITNLKHIKKR
jgi:uncharacterized membrane protein YcjF (UPF0283 family)